MTALEQVLKDAWTAGFQQGANGDDTRDIPPEWYFEQYMEKVVAELVGENRMDNELARWKELAAYRLALLMKMPEHKQWAALAEVIRDVEDKLKEKNNGD